MEENGWNGKILSDHTESLLTKLLKPAAVYLYPLSVQILAVPSIPVVI